MAERTPVVDFGSWTDKIDYTSPDTARAAAAGASVPGPQTPPYLRRRHISTARRSGGRERARAFCVGSANQDGDALVSTDATEGPSSWTPVLADPISCSLTPFGACGTEQIIASGRTGVYVLDSSTEFEPQTGPSSPVWR